jgi:hypothetical protein
MSHSPRSTSLFGGLNSLQQPLSGTASLSQERFAKALHLRPEQSVGTETRPQPQRELERLQGLEVG